MTLEVDVLALFPAVDVTAPLFFLVYGGVLLSFLALLPHPQALVVGFRSYGWVAFLRSVTLLLTPLDPPAGMILLRDPIVEATVHGAVAPTRDLFFSGHTSTLLLVALVTPGRRVKTALATAAVLVGTMVLLQKVHYTIDVVCALPFALTAAWIGRAFPRRRAAAPAA